MIAIRTAVAPAMKFNTTMKRKPATQTVRNPYVALALNRKAGTHRKSNKVLRRSIHVRFAAHILWLDASLENRYYKYES